MAIGSETFAQLLVLKTVGGTRCVTTMLFSREARVGGSACLLGLTLACPDSPEAGPSRLGLVSLHTRMGHRAGGWILEPGSWRRQQDDTGVMITEVVNRRTCV